MAWEHAPGALGVQRGRPGSPVTLKAFFRCCWSERQAPWPSESELRRAGELGGANGELPSERVIAHAAGVAPRGRASGDLILRTPPVTVQLKPTTQYTHN